MWEFHYVPDLATHQPPPSYSAVIVTKVVLCLTQWCLLFWSPDICLKKLQKYQFHCIRWLSPLACQMQPPSWEPSCLSRGQPRRSLLWVPVQNCFSSVLRRTGFLYIFLYSMPPSFVSAGVDSLFCLRNALKKCYSESESCNKFACFKF